MHYAELEELYDQYGGKFRLTVLLQKRVAQLVSGERRLVRGLDTDDPIEVAIAEAREGKIWLVEDEVQTSDIVAGTLGEAVDAEALMD